MILLILFLACMFAALGAGFLAGQSDLRGLTIPNSYSAIIGGSFLVAYSLMWLFARTDVFGPLLSHIMAALIIFMVTAALFALRTMGAADSKLATVYALWVGLRGVPALLFYMAVVGGLLALAALALRKWKPVKSPAPGSWLARVQEGENKVPYGIAIACGALASFIKIGYLGTEVLGSFLTS